MNRKAIEAIAHTTSRVLTFIGELITYRSIRQCRRTRQVVPGVYQSFVCGVHRLFISWHIQDIYHDYYNH